MLKSCPQCHTTFKTYHRTAIYCGKACHSASMKTAPCFTCAYCGSTFRRPRHQIKHDAAMRFCNRECHANWKRSNARQISCRHCGVRVAKTTGSFCTPECRYAHSETAMQSVCENCGNTFRAFLGEVQRGRRFCSPTCAHDAMIGPDHPNYRGGKWLKHGKRWEQVRAKALVRDRVCVWCGAASSKNGRSLHVHHIKPRRDYLIVDIANEIDNLVALCSSCHTRLEMFIQHGRTSQIPKQLQPPK